MIAFSNFSSSLARPDLEQFLNLDFGDFGPPSWLGGPKIRLADPKIQNGPQV
jgi:hypothetical protein